VHVYVVGIVTVVLTESALDPLVLDTVNVHVYVVGIVTVGAVKVGLTIVESLKAIPPVHVHA